MLQRFMVQIRKDLEKFFKWIAFIIKKSYRNGIRCFKGKGEDFSKMAIYSPQDQSRIICATFAFYNYIRLSKIIDPTFWIIDRNPNFIPPEAFSNVECIFDQNVNRAGTNEMTKVRNNITASLMVARRQHCGS